MTGGMGSAMSGFGMVNMWTPLLLGIAFLALLVWAFAEALRREERPVIVRNTTFEDVLRGRLDRGEISAREFEEALRQLRDS